MLTAIDFYEKIKTLIPESTLVIIGHCPSTSFYKKLKTEINKGIELDVSTTPISHAEIVQKILNSDFGIVSYNVNPSNENCMPTKVFEYLAYGLPITCQSETIWSEYISKFNAGVFLNFKQFELASTADQLIKFNKSFIYKDIPEVRWETEEKKFVELINQILLK